MRGSPVLSTCRDDGTLWMRREDRTVVSHIGSSAMLASPGKLGLSVHSSIFSKVGASAKPGVIQVTFFSVMDSIFSRR